MNVRIKIRCDCGCSYEFNHYFKNDLPLCPNCRKCDNDVLTHLNRAFEEFEQIPKEAWNRISIRVQKSED